MTVECWEGSIFRVATEAETNVKDYRRDFGGEPIVANDEYHPQDDLQTPPYAIAALTEFMPTGIRIAWEPAKGEGLLAQAVRDQFGFDVIETGIEEGFFESCPPLHYDVQLTNPPWAKKYRWLERTLELYKPFALLLPSKMLFAAKAIHMIENNDLEIIQVYPRIGYKSVNMSSFLESRPQLDSCWITRGFNMGRRLTYVYIGHEKKRFLADLKAQEKGQYTLF